MLFYDFEVMKYDWLVVILDMMRKAEHVIVNDKEKLEQLYNENKNNIWVGFNSRHYDQYILKAILAGFNPKEMSDWIILHDRKGWQFSDLLSKFPLNNFDVMQSLDRGLKAFEGSMGNDIRESTVSFDIDRKLTEAEIQETIKYCRHDVGQTVEVFMRRKADFEAEMSLIQMFGLPLRNISKTKVQLSAEILEASCRNYNDEFDISFPPTMQIEKYQEVVKWYKTPANLRYLDDAGKKTKLRIDVAGVPHIFGWGGVHGARVRYNKEGYFINMDVASLYPSLMIRYNLHSRSCNPAKFEDIVKTRLKLKAEKNPLQEALKIVINGTYGAMKDENNPLYDPRQANNVCVYGQLLLLDLIEHLEPFCEVVQSNTDGVLIKCPPVMEAAEDEWYDLIDDVAYEWEQRTGLNLEFDEYRKVFQKDVNNYIIVDGDGHYKSKGAWVKPWLDKKGNPLDLDYDCVILRKAAVEFMVNGIPPEQTINECDDLRQFQQVKKISSKYDHILHGGEVLSEKTVRCFASKDVRDGGLMKFHKGRGSVAKIEETPEHCFLDNSQILGVKCSQNLDRQWYVQVVKDRLTAFGVIK